MAEITVTAPCPVDRKLIDRFLALNPMPEFRIVTHSIGTQLHHFASNRGHVGWYRSDVITIFPDLCTYPGTGYSWPGHVSDRTEQGVLAHELGHHWHFSQPHHLAIAEAFPRRQQDRVTGYEPNAYESVAETFRLFVLNPALLREGRPERYAFMLSHGLVPSEDRGWREVLGAIPSRMLARIPPWIARGNP